MTRYAPMWEQNATYPAAQDRQLIGTIWPGTQCNGMAASVVAGTLTVNIAPGSLVVPDPNTYGASYLCVSDAVENVAIPLPVPPTGQARIDVVTVMPRDSAVIGANNDWVFNVVSSAVAVSPTPPAIPAGQVAVVQIAVAGGATALVAGNLTERRPGSAAIVPANPGPPVGASAPFQSWQDSSSEWWVAKGGVNGGAWRKARDVLHARAYRAGAFTVIAGTANNLAMDTVDLDPYGILTAGFFTFPLAGLWQVSGATGVSIGVNQWVRGYVKWNDRTNLVAAYSSPIAIGGGFPYPADVRKVAAGATALMANDGSATITGTPGATATWLSADYLGTG